MAHLNPGGTERQVLRFVQTFDPQRVRCSLISWQFPTPNLKTEFESAGCQVYALSRYRYRGLLFPLDLLRAGIRANPHIVHGWLNAGLYWGAPLAIGVLRRPLVLSVRSDPAEWPGWIRIANTIFAPWCAWMLSNSERSRQRYRRLCHGVPSRHEVQYNGMDIARFQPPNQAELRKQTRTELGLSDANQAITIVGRLRREKDHTLLFRAAQVLSRESPNLRVLVVGEGEQEAQLRQWVQQQDLGEIVRFVGHREDVPAILAASDLHVLCSQSEGMPNAVLEALAAGRPIVSTDVGGVREVITDGVEGLIVPPRDQDALTEAIRFMLRNPDRASEMAHRGQQTIGQRFDIRQVTERLTQIYERLAARAG
jgi:glycosyltransferase involved in cell wall biosynthesis